MEAVEEKGRDGSSFGMKRRGPRIEPCGTPEMTDISEEIYTVKNG